MNTRHDATEELADLEQQGLVTLDYDDPRNPDSPCVVRLTDEGRAVAEALIAEMHGRLSMTN